jgi:uncharacterized membrane protein
MGRRWLILALVASLTLNLFLIGAAAGVIALGMTMARNSVARPGAFIVATQDLPDADRHAMRLKLRQARDASMPDVVHSLAVRSAAWGALGEAKPDVAAIKQQLAQSRQLDIAVRTRVEEQIVDDAAAMSPADRTIFAAGMARALHPPPAPAPASTQATPAKP